MDVKIVDMSFDPVLGVLYLVYFASRDPQNLWASLIIISAFEPISMSHNTHHII